MEAITQTENEKLEGRTPRTEEQSFQDERPNADAEDPLLCRNNSKDDGNELLPPIPIAANNAGE